MTGDAGIPDLRRLVLDWQRPLYNLAYRMLGNRADAEDATQEAFARILRRIGAYDPKRPLRPWIYRLATNVILNRIRAARTRRAREVAARSAPVSSEEETVQRREREALVRAQVAELPGESRALLVLHFYNGLPKQEVAEVLGLPRTTVQSRFGKALETLHGNLRRNGHAALAPVAGDLMREAPAVPVPDPLTKALLSQLPAAAGTGAGLGLGGLLMGKKLIVGALIVFALGLSGGYLVGTSDDPDPEVARLQAENQRLKDALAASDAPAPGLVTTAERDLSDENRLASREPAAARSTPKPEAGAATSPSTAPKASGIDWDRFADLFSDSVELVARSDNMKKMAPEERTRMVTLMTEYMRIATAARERSDKPFFDRMILPEYVEAVFGKSLGLSEADCAKLREHTAGILAEVLEDVDPQQDLPLQILRARRRILQRVTASMEGRVAPEMRDRMKQVRTIARHMMSGDHESVRIGIKDVSRRPHHVDKILERWKRVFGLEESQLDAVRPAAERFLQSGEDALRSRGFARADAVPTPSEQAELDEAFARLQLQAESSILRQLTESQRKAMSGSMPVLITFAWGDGEHSAVSNNGGI